jgi:hypothetical protein
VTARSSRALPSSWARTCSWARGSQREPVLRRAGDPPRPVEAVEEAPAHLVLLEHEGHGLGLVDRSPPGAAALRVGGQRLLQLVGEPQVVHHQPARLVAEDAVHAGDGLHQAAPAHGLVDVHRVQAGGVEAGEPHVAHDDQPERVLGLPEPVGERLPAGLVPDVELPVRPVVGGARHHDLHRALAVVVVVPPRAEGGDLAVQLDADAPAHAHHHRLAVHRGQPVLEMVHQVARDELEPAPGSHHRLELRPLRLEPLLALDLLAFGRLLELGVDPGPLGLLQLELREAALVVDGHGGAIDDRALDVVDGDVVPEDRARVGIGLLDGRPGEADERGAGQGIAHVPGEAVDEVVLAPVRLVGDHHDVVAVRQDRLAVSPLLGEELLNRGEHDPAARHPQLLAQVGPARHVDGRLAQQVAAPGEGAEELVVEVVAVGEDDDRRVRHLRVQDQPARVEGHGEALARALRVPDDSHAPVPRLAAPPPAGLEPARILVLLDPTDPGGPQRLLHRDVHRMELVVARHLLRERAAQVLEHDEVPHQVEEPALLEHALEHHLQLGQPRGGILAPGHGAPGLEPLTPRTEGADPSLKPVGDDEGRVVGEERRDLRLVGLELLEGRPDGWRPRPPRSSARRPPAGGR